MTTLDSILKRNQNNFDLIRLCAAVAVIFGHAFGLHPSGEWREPVNQLLGFTYSGALAVDIFFFLSGILVTGSFCQSKSHARFFLMRFARIWPGLVVCLIISALAVGPVVTTLPFGEYVVAWQTRWYVLTNLQLDSITYDLPGVFKANHHKRAVNGSLWTLPIEVRCYAVVFLAGVIGCLKSGLRTIALGFILILIALILPESLGYLRVKDESVRMPLIFLFGMVCYTNRARIPVDWRLSLFALLIAIIFSSTWAGKIAFYLFLLNTILVIGGFQWLRRFQPPGDYSYGIYLYGFVVQQIVANYLPSLTSYPSMVISIPLSCILGIVSWKYLERPALDYARSLSSKYEHNRMQMHANGKWL